MSVSSSCKGRGKGLPPLSFVLTSWGTIVSGPVCRDSILLILGVLARRRRVSGVVRKKEGKKEQESGKNSNKWVDNAKKA